MNELKIDAQSKINLGLDVLGRFPNGYHEVRMVMQTLELHDSLKLTKKTEPGITLTANVDYVPLNQDNLICKAGKLLMDEFGITEGIAVELEKNIPVAAGMAGGSTDAAAMMIGVNQLFDLGLNREELMQRAVKIGADVPYCILKGTALAEGIGEKLTRLTPMVSCPVLVAKPDIDVSTKFVYTHLDMQENPEHPDIDAQLDAIRAEDLKGIAAAMGNILQTVTVPAYPVIDEIKKLMMDQGALNSMMTGSGPTVFGLFEDEKTAESACEAMKKSGLAKQVFLTAMYNVGEDK